MAEGAIFQGTASAIFTTQNVPTSQTSQLVSAVAPALESHVSARTRHQSPVLLPVNSSLHYAVRDALVILDGVERSGVLGIASDTWAGKHVVDVAVSFYQGLQMLQLHRYKLLLIDLNADGLNLLHILRIHPALRPPAVLVIGDLDLYSQVWGSIEAGADDYLAVPCHVNDMHMRLELWLRRVGAAASNAPPGLRIYSLGHFSVMRNGELRLQETGRARKVNMLFKYLLAHLKQTVHTGEIFELIWPDIDEKVAATDLRSLLHQLRKLLGTASSGGACIQHSVTTLGLRLSPGDWWDVEAFTAWTREAAYWQKVGETVCAIQAYEAAIELYQGDFLCDDHYVEWILPMREQLREQWLQALAAVATLHAERGEYGAQEAALRALVAADPYREHNLRLLMELLAAQGRGAEALVLYRKLRDLLVTELDAHPDPETRVLATYIGQRSR